MPKEVLVAIVTASAALLVATIGLLSALRSAREQRQTQNSLEEIKQRIAIDNDRRQKKNEMLKVQNELLAKDIGLIQASRDHLRRLIDATPGIVRMEEIRILISTAVKEITDQYAIHVAADAGEHVKSFHAAKLILLDVQRKIDEITPVTEYASQIIEEDLKEIRSARERLTSIQEVLKQEQIKILQNYIQQ